MEPIVKVAKQLINATTSPTEFQKLSLELNIGDLYPKGQLNNNQIEYMTYLGSLTTPTCDQKVLWTVFLNSVPTSERQVKFNYNLN